MMQPASGGIASVAPQMAQAPRQPQQQPQQMPGQAGPQALQNILQQGQGAGGIPAPGGAGIAADVSKLPDSVLATAVMGQVQGVAPYSALGELQKRNTEKQNALMMQGQKALAAAQQQSQQPPIAQQVIAQAAQLGQTNNGVGAIANSLPNKLATGGLVAFNDGGDTRIRRLAQELMDREAMEEYERRLRGEDPLDLRRGSSFDLEFPIYDIPSKPSAAPNQSDAESARLLRQNQMLQQAAMERARRQQAQQEQQARRQAEGARASESSSQRMAGPMSQPSVGAQVPGLTAPNYDADINALKEAMRNRQSGLRTQSGISDEEAAARAERNRLSRENIDISQREADTEAAYRKRLYDMAMGRANKSPLEDPEALFALAGAINPKRGRVMGSLGQGMAGILGGRRQEAAAAERAYGESMSKQREMNAAIRTRREAEMDRQAAIRAGDQARVDQLNNQIQQIDEGIAKLGIEMKGKGFDEGVKGFNAQSQRMGAEAQVRQASAAERNAATNEAYRRQMAATAQQKAGPGGLSPEKAEALRLRIEKAVDDKLKTDMNYKLLQSTNPQEARARRDRMIQEDYQRSLVQMIKDAGSAMGASSAVPTPGGERILEWNLGSK